MGIEIINQIFTGTSVMAIILFLIAGFLFFLPIIFMIGTLTRLTDIKYKMDDLIFILEQKNDTKSHAINEDIDSEIEKDFTEKNEEKDVSFKQRMLNIKSSVVNLRHPSKAFLFTLFGGVAFFSALLGSMCIWSIVNLK